MSGAGIVTPEADAAEIQKRYEDLMSDMRPQSPAGEIAVRLMASLSYRAERAAEHESAAIAKNVRNAADAHDEERITQAEALSEALAENPRSSLRKLRKTPEGVECLYNAWLDLKSDLDDQAEWTDESLERAAHLCGIHTRHARGSRYGALTRALRGDFGGLKAEDGAGLADEARKEWARGEMLEQIDAEIAELIEHYQTLDFEIIEADRAEAGQRALFDMSKAGILARRYEAELRRGFFKALKEFRQVEAEFAARAQAAPSRPAPPPAPSKLGSFREMTPPPDRGWSPGDPVAPSTGSPADFRADDARFGPDPSFKDRR